MCVAVRRVLYKEPYLIPYCSLADGCACPAAPAANFPAHISDPFQKVGNATVHLGRTVKCNSRNTSLTPRDWCKS